MFIAANLFFFLGFYAVSEVVYGGFTFNNLHLSPCGIISKQVNVEWMLVVYITSRDDPGNGIYVSNRRITNLV